MLFIAPREHSRGIAPPAWALVENQFPKVSVWTTYTPYFETRNIHFYLNCSGFHIVEYYHARHPDPQGQIQVTSDDRGLFRFEKRLGNRPSGH